MVMMIRADRPSSSLAKIVLRIFEGDTRMYQSAVMTAEGPFSQPAVKRVHRSRPN
jgi:hypothetical protein